MASPRSFTPRAAGTVTTPIGRSRPGARWRRVVLFGAAAIFWAPSVLIAQAGDRDRGTLVVLNKSESTATFIDVASGEVECTIPTDAGPHGLTYFPTPGVHSIGHNGLMIDEAGNIE